jgi:hypothetical protein
LEEKSRVEGFEMYAIWQKKKKKFFKVVNKNVMVVKKLTPLTTNQVVCNRT